LEEINRHFSNFHSYRPPSYSEEVWDQVSADDLYLTTPKDCSIPADLTDGERGTSKVPSDLTPIAAQHRLPIQNPTSYFRSMSPYCASSPGVFTPLVDAPSSWLRPEIVSVPGTDYSMMEHPGLPNTVFAPDTTHSPQDFYTCVHLMNESGEVHLVPCLPPAYCQEFPPFPGVGSDAAEEEKKKLAEYQARKRMMNGLKDGGESQRSEAAVPLLPVAVDNTG